MSQQKHLNLRVTITDDDGIVLDSMDLKAAIQETLEEFKNDPICESGGDIRRMAIFELMSDASKSIKKLANQRTEAV